MANVLEIVIKAQDLASGAISAIGDAGEGAADQLVGVEESFDDIGSAARDAVAPVDDVGAAAETSAGFFSGLGSAASNAAAFINENWEKITVASGGAGAAAEGFARKQLGVTEQLEKTGAALGIESDELRDLAISISNVTFPLEDAVSLMATGQQQGLETAEQLGEFATFWDMVGDASGEAGAELGKASIALRAVGIEAGNDKEALSALGFITEKTTGSVGDFLTFLERTGPELREMDADINDAAAILGILEGEFGMSGRTARSEFRSAISESDGTLEGLLETLGVSQDVFDDYRRQVEESSGVIERNAEIHAESYTPLEKLSHGAQELMMRYGGLADVAGMLAPVLMALGPAGKIVSGAFTGISSATGALGKAFTFLAANPVVLIISALAALGAGLVALYNNSETFRNFVLSVWEAIQNAIKWAWENVISPVWEAIKAGMTFLIELGKMYMEAWKAVFRTVGDWIRQIWNTRIKPVWDLFKTGIDNLVSFARNLRDRWNEFWGAIGNKVRDIWNNTVKPTWDSIKGGIDSVRETAETLGKKWGEIWDGIKTAVKNTVNSVIGFINGAIGGVEKLINALANGINSLPKFTIPDWVPGIGGNTFGLPHVPTVRLPRVPQLASGGIVKARPGGILAVIGEGGRDERVSPIGGPDDPMVQVVMLLKELIKAVRESRSLSVDGRELASALGSPFVEEIRARTGL